MWAGLFVTLFAFATIMTLLYLDERSVVFASAMGGSAWAILALTPDIMVTSGGEELAFDIGGARYLLLGLALLSMIVLFLDIFGAYREESTDFDSNTGSEMR